MKDEIKQKRLKKIIILLILTLFAINIPLISAYFFVMKFGTFTVYPGEKYTLNIPFIGQSKLATICGKALQTDGTLLEGINITLKYYGNSTSLAKNITGSDGKFCFTLNITSNKKFDVYIEYDNSTLTPGSNDYELNFDDNKIYHKSSDIYAFLSGDIVNKDAQVENGRFEIKMGQKVDGTWKYVFGDYQQYLLNINPNEVYEVPSDELNFSKDITSLEAGEYKFLIKTSFNGEEKTSVGIFFNITN